VIYFKSVGKPDHSGKHEREKIGHGI